MDSDTLTRMFLEENKEFIKVVKEIPFNKNLNTIKRKIKKYNLELNLTIEKDNDFPNISKVAIKQIDDTGIYFNYDNVESLKDNFVLDYFTYFSKFVFIGEGYFRFTHVFNSNSKILKNSPLDISFTTNQDPVKLLLKIFDETEQDKMIEYPSKSNKNYINTLNKHISIYNINVYKLMVNDKKYIKSLDETLDHILLEHDDNTLRELIYETNFCGCFSTEKLIIEKKQYNMINLYKREQKVSKRFHFLFGSKILKTTLIFFVISLCLYLTSFLFIK